MKITDLLILLPCHSLEDFPLQHQGADAQSVLACWTALWHPALLASAQRIPRWRRVDDPPESTAHHLIVVPTIAEAELPSGLATRAEAEGALMLCGKTDRNDILAAALERLDGGDAGVDAELAADFLALGFCYLQVQLLTRQMRYSSNLDEIHFQTQVVAAADAAVAGDTEQGRELLAKCFDTLAEERDHYYPVDAYLIDLTLIAPTTVGQALRDQLADDVPQNLMLSVAALQAMATDQPETLTALQAALRRGGVGLIGGEADESPLPLLSPESILDQLRRGLQRYEELLGRTPAVFGRRRFGLTPALPQLLHKLGFAGALHATLDDGQFPEGTQVKTSWQGLDGTTVDTLARAPLDAARAESFLSFAVKMGESMDMDHVATTCLAHWPGMSSPWYDDLRRTASYVGVLGKFLAVDDFFADTDHPGQLDTFQGDAYRSPYLKQDVAAERPDPISQSVRYWRRQLSAQSCRALGLLAQLLGGDEPSTSELLDEADRTALEALAEPSDQLQQRLDAELQKQAADVADRLPRDPASSQRQGYLLLNPLSFVRRLGADLPQLEQTPAVERPVYAADRSDAQTHAVVDVPPMGFAWVGGGGGRRPSKRQPPVLAEDDLLRNEFIQARIDPTTGALRTVNDYQSRNNRLSQQLAMRYADDGRPTYSVMAADRVQTTADRAKGQIDVEGRLLDRNGKCLADFRQSYQLWRGSRVLLLDVELQPHTMPQGDPWESYYGCRFAWNNEAADLLRTVNLGRKPTANKRIEAPLYVEINDGRTRTAVLTGGLPYHRRAGLRMLDTLLIVPGETARQFRLGISLDATHPLQHALGLLTPPVELPGQTPPAGAASGWLFHLDAKNVVSTHWQPIVEQQRLCGFRVRLLETDGRAAKLTLSAMRPIASARSRDFQGQPIDDVAVDKQGHLQLDVGAHAWMEIEARWPEA